MRKSLGFILLSLVLLQCTENKVPKESFTIDKPDSTDIYYELIGNLTKQLGLANIEQGVQGEEIRLWILFELSYENEVIVLKKESNQWKAFHYPYRYDYGNDEVKRITEFTKVEPEPQSGWQDLITTLKRNQIATLPDMDKVEGLDDRWTDGVSYLIEIAGPTIYCFYRYHLPEKFADQFWQAQKMTTIIDKIEAEFQLRERKK